MFQCIWNACVPNPIQSNHMQIYKHEYINIKLNHTNMLCNYHFNIKISSLGLMFKHKQFDSNYLTKHIFSQNYPRNIKTLGFTVPTHNKSSVHFVNPHFMATSDLKPNQYMINTKTHKFTPTSAVEQLRAAPFCFKILY